jgi:outer membrane murein-binding lipoprotein Lpp
MTTGRLAIFPVALAGGLLLSACAHLKVDPIEVKEIHIVHDVNIHVDKELNDYFAFQEQAAASQSTTAPATQTATKGV